jgi:hypothetical protein
LRCLDIRGKEGIWVIAYLSAVREDWEIATDDFLTSADGKAKVGPYDEWQFDCLQKVLSAMIVAPPCASVAEKESVMKYSEALLTRRLKGSRIDPSWVDVALKYLQDVARLRDSAYVAVRSLQTEPIPDQPPTVPPPDFDLDPRVLDPESVEIHVD